uniref:Uncharacterized protein n=1 Tax=Glossina palpalis gambiensis TaxID=67801 RepID=A0A1B0ASV3_9MUSC
MAPIHQSHYQTHDYPKPKYQFASIKSNTSDFNVTINLCLKLQKLFSPTRSRLQIREGQERENLNILVVQQVCVYVLFYSCLFGNSEEFTFVTNRSRNINCKRYLPPMSSGSTPKAEWRRAKKKNEMKLQNVAYFYYLKKAIGHRFHDQIHDSPKPKNQFVRKKKDIFTNFIYFTITSGGWIFISSLVTFQRPILYQTVPWKLSPALMYNDSIFFFSCSLIILLTLPGVKIIRMHYS